MAATFELQLASHFAGSDVDADLRYEVSNAGRHITVMTYCYNPAEALSWRVSYLQSEEVPLLLIGQAASNKLRLGLDKTLTAECMVPSAIQHILIYCISSLILQICIK